MENQITGKVIAVSGIQTVQSKVSGQQPKELRQLFMDCTRYDPYTGERSQYENTPLLDFKGENMKLLDGIEKGDVVTVSFDVNGYKYQDEQGKQRVFTSIRPYKVIKRVKQQPADAGQQVQQQAASQPADAAPVPPVPPIPGIGNDLPF